MRIGISGAGILSPIGIGISAFSQALKEGKSNFSLLEIKHLENTYSYPNASIEGFDYKKEIDLLALPLALKKQAKQLRNISMGGKHGIYTALEAWEAAGFFENIPNPDKVAIIASGSNTQQATLIQNQERYRKKLKFINPTYGFNFLDTDIVGTLSELLNIKGEGLSVGAASASGNMALIQAYRLIESGLYDVVLVVAPTMELSVYEYQGFTALGAMAVLTPDKNIESLCNPFDLHHCGFVFGQNAGAIILESVSHAEKRNARLPVFMTGYGCSLDGNRNPNPSAIGEAKAMQIGLDTAGINIEQINYINTHGTASVIGDTTEIEAILSVGGKGIKVNATKGLIGHGITTAGLVEAIVCLIQIKDGFLHANPNLNAPITKELSWIKETIKASNLDYCMSNSYGFGGINTSIIFQNNIP